MKRGTAASASSQPTVRKLPRLQPSTSQTEKQGLPDKHTSCKPGLKRAGHYLLGPRLGSSPVRSIVQCLARKEGTDDFYTIKILTMEEPEWETQDDRQGKMLMHTEYSLLSLLHGQDGVVHHHALFKDEAWEESPCENGLIDYTGRRKRRLCLVLDCLIPHDFSPRTADLVNLQHYVIKEKKLTEKEAIVIFFDIVRVVDSLHKKNIVHRDLKLGNMVLNKSTRRITITNFCLGKHLVSESDLLRDQRGSPAYISPDVLSGKPYLGKPSDMWALGVVLFTMLYGQFPFYDMVPQELFRKIKSAEYTIPNDGRVSENSLMVIRRLLILDPQTRMTASQVLDALGMIITTWKAMTVVGPLQIVPDMDDGCLQIINKTTPPSPSSSAPSDLEIKLHQLQSDNVHHDWQPKPILARKKVGPTQTLIRRVNADAQPLNAIELVTHRHIIHQPRS
ncbi:serine/threonine-protein kinase 40-like [Gigantopelta aegis]|uniref:serine/threonine-protein kinase 40-like n=1 Tax=Gigantopelta aegis TaxID=1735272 RepID=UPI001B88D764|nr:serine/threonine-protein kinase 40-like [Gigantopelta aegis]XP_041352012.1 serine/threonine-protein kinase 40-like [Gigantopelta aegis]XP_041352013.1 serine/threonine-protein kinase 40-like [Gigantopelta aegis]XP_041352014.1 serine/threonine-protein kinase 40-like [Gigantopelta aegis]